jgi:osmotically-inducible protein OsmY
MTQTMVISDRELKSAIVDELEWTPSVNSTHIGVTVTDGAVTLFGEVDSYPEKRLAEKAAERVRGVSAIAEDITVRATWAALNDTDIARETDETLRRSVDVPDSVQLSVNDGTVTLSGTVTWQFERAAAARAVRYAKGVRAVHDEITIRPGVVAADLTTAIGAALLRNAELEAEHITVLTHTDGSVTLTGAVASWSERRQAEHVAWSAPGATRVTNLLTVVS